jgi:hypothetical protein
MQTTHPPGAARAQPQNTRRGGEEEGSRKDLEA